MKTKAQQIHKFPAVHQKPRVGVRPAGRPRKAGASVYEPRYSSDTPDAEVLGVVVPRAEKKRSNTPASFLAMYFQEMAQLEVLKPEEEFHQARVIEELEVALWDEMFRYAPLVEHLLKVVEHKMNGTAPEFRAVRRCVAQMKDASGARHYDKLARIVHKCFVRVHFQDLDRELL